MSVSEWLKKHGACQPGYDWAVENCRTMQDVWDSAKPEWLIWLATRPGVLTDREKRLFARACVRRIWHLLTDERSRNAIEVSERYAAGKATDDEMKAAYYGAYAAAADAAARDDASYTTYAADAAVSYYAAYYADDAAPTTPYYCVAAATEAAYTAIADTAAADAEAAYTAIADTAAADAEAAERAYQADWLRTNTKPKFE